MDSLSVDNTNNVSLHFEQVANVNLCEYASAAILRRCIIFNDVSAYNTFAKVAVLDRYIL